MSPPAPLVPAVRRLLVVCAHPYDATFALGGVIAAFAGSGAAVRLLCLTHGRRPDPGRLRRSARADELRLAAGVLGIEDVTLLDLPAGSLGTINLSTLAHHVVTAAQGADALLTVDATGDNAHPDHVRAMHAAFRAAIRLGRPLYARTIAPRYGSRRHHLTVHGVDRVRQGKAIACHRDLPADDALRAHWRRTQHHPEWLVVLAGAPPLAARAPARRSSSAAAASSAPAATSPIAPAPTGPAPAGPAPAGPAPTEPAPTEPASTAPTPVAPPPATPVTTTARPTTPPPARRRSRNRQAEPA